MSQWEEANEEMQGEIDQLTRAISETRKSGEKRIDISLSIPEAQSLLVYRKKVLKHLTILCTDPEEPVLG